ncbi:hypothetical protein DTO013E5_9159 [Penicillium roqueforti]|nr:hypothetical protein DTO012A1_9984 [Penicillium roqueforti]KAI2737998.1 hypothetical protein DTO013F2_9686 [Penicillium roqueforti]KAI3129632.1 hypothetical protein CBS147325_9592 [Penicillium roqueforti]KAI3147995.1 hypothetical protein DTO046C5_9994 [Penicillium roqueforti]KAI3200149.1 hypothetical protein DTO013E5_9159 [Penicillium roqueforti]
MASDLNKHTYSSLLTRINTAASETTLIRRPDPGEFIDLLKLAVPGASRPIEEVIKDAHEIFSFRIAVSHPRFFSYIPSPASPLSKLGDCLTTAHNPFGGSWEASAGVCTIETGLIKWIAQIFGLPSSAGGQFVSGASMANLTAMVVARDQTLRVEERSNGVAYISEQTHFCVRKALRIIGIPDHQIREIKTDSKFRMNLSLLEKTIDEDLQNHRKPFLLVASCGTTNTGSIDALEDLARIAQGRRMWLHIDAAYGGSVAFSETHRSKVKDICFADSVAWDAHKWLFQTHGCGAVFFRDQSQSLESFSSTGDYVRDVECQEELPDPWNYGVELTRPARHMRLWFTLQVLGLQKFDQMICHGFELSRHLECMISTLDDWEIISPSSLAILNFRYAPQGVDLATLNQLNEAISKEIASRDVAVIFTSHLDNLVCLRMCTINPETSKDDIEHVVKSLDNIAREVHSPSRKEVLWRE